MKRASLFAVALVAIVALATPSAFHFAVTKSTPTNNQALDASPKRIQIWFSQVPVEAVSVIKLVGSDKADVALGKVVADKESKSIYADVATALKPGAYVVSWKSAGDDGHVQNGEIKFKLAPK